MVCVGMVERVTFEGILTRAMLPTIQHRDLKQSGQKTPRRASIKK